MPPHPATYRDRLRREGLTLAACGVLACVLLLAFADGATDHRISTILQILTVAVLMTVLGLRSVHSAIAGAHPLDPGKPGSGEPTPLWQMPLIVGGLTGIGLVLLGPDAALRVGGGCTIVGLVQALVLKRAIAAAERRDGRRYVRTAGSRILRGSRLAYLD